MPRTRRLAATAVALAGLSIAAACGAGSSTTSTADGATAGTAAPSGSVAGSRITPPLNMSDVTFTDFSADPNGAPFPFKAASGKLLVTYFGYLSCPDICPTTMSDISAALQRMAPADREKVQVAFVTIDPERDTGAKVAGFVEHFVPDGHGLRAPDDSTLWTSTSRLGVQYKIEAHAPGSSYGVSHTGYQYVIDDQGRAVWVWPYGTPSKDLAATLTALVRGETPAVA
ncbi:MAG: SCO family protein [Acidimicrobiales bacterium]